VKTNLLFVMFAVCATGCASTGLAAPHALGVANKQADAAPSVRPGDARVLDMSINPLAPIHLAPGDGTIDVRFARPRQGAMLKLDPLSLLPTSPATPVPIDAEAGPLRGPAHAPLKGGRVLLCWREGDALSGYRLQAQAWTPSGYPLGRAVTVSPVDVDVVGSAQLLALDGERAVATFVAASGGRFELMAVSLEVL
jgi:hypothetical protein